MIVLFALFAGATMTAFMATVLAPLISTVSVTWAGQALSAILTVVVTTTAHVLMASAYVMSVSIGRWVHSASSVSLDPLGMLPLK